MHFGGIKYRAVKALGLQTPVTFSLTGIPVTLRPNTPDVNVAYSCFAGEFVAAMDACSPLQHNFIIDAGGYIGTAAIVFARRFPDATIVSLEPSVANFAILRKNAARYGNIMPMNVALGASDGRTRLVDRKTGYWGYSIVQEPKDCLRAEALHEVPTVTIDTLLKQFSATGIDLLKLDIEGAERDLMISSQPWINKTRVMIAELHEWIVSGAELAFSAATVGRNNIQSNAEKILSVRL
jgi:FkbM family methyltransferase